VTGKMSIPSEAIQRPQNLWVAHRTHRTHRWQRSSSSLDNQQCVPPDGVVGSPHLFAPVLSFLEWWESNAAKSSCPLTSDSEVALAAPLTTRDVTQEPWR